MLLDLDDETTAGLASALAASPSTLDPSVLAGHVVQHVPKLDRRRVEALLASLLSLYSLRASLEKELPAFVDDITDSLEVSGITIADNQREPFTTHLSILLSIPTQELRIKQVDVQSANQRTFLSTRIITDLRPVFSGRDVSARPAGAVVVHSLQLDYSESGRPQEFFLALDEEDLDALARVIERAKEKAKALTAILEDAKVPYLKGVTQ